MTTVCRHCGEQTTRNGVTEFYELHHHYHEDSDERIAVAGPGGRMLHVPIPSDASMPHQLVGVFCSAKCLTTYVQAHIAPDAAGE